jgi:hypothetical protein
MKKNNTCQQSPKGHKNPQAILNDRQGPGRQDQPLLCAGQRGGAGAGRQCGDDEERDENRSLVVCNGAGSR